MLTPLATFLVYSSAALFIGFLLDLAVGDPPGFPHIVRGMGSLITGGERCMRHIMPNTPHGERTGGTILVIVVVLLVTAIPALVLFLAFYISPWLYLVMEALLCWQLLATKSLRVESHKVYDALEAHDIAQARAAVSQIVGRDTETLDEAGVIRATVETVAENTADGVIAPLFYLMIGGAMLGCVYKAINTMDSMLGYKNERYIDFGHAAARLDDAANLIPARLAARLMIVAARLTDMDVEGAHRIYLRDRDKHASPNSAHTEAVMAGALGVQLAGDACYFGRLYEKPAIGDALRPIEPRDIICSHTLLLATAALMLIACGLVRGCGIYAAI